MGILHISLIINALFFCAALIGIVNPQPLPSEAEILLKFKQSLTSTDALNNWNASTSPCKGDKRIWAGVLCSEGRVWGLQLENMSLSGGIDIDALVKLSQLRTLSFMNNSFSGPLPPINRLGWLKSLFFSYNNFSGEIGDDAFKGMMSLKKVYMGHNSFSGRVPQSLADLPKLIEVSLENNQFLGHVPDFKSHNLKLFNLSSNFFDGPIPPSLRQMNSSSFLGNPGLCGAPLQNQCPKSNTLSITIIIVVTISLLVLITFIFLVARNKNQDKKTPKRSSRSHDLEGGSVGGSGRPPLHPHHKSNRHKHHSNGVVGHNNNPQQARTSLDRPTSYKKSDNGKLCFLRNDRQKFEMQDLLKASAEVLGSGSFGSSYKAAIVGGPNFVVKRFRQMNNVGKEEFQDHMKRLGRLRHPNILPLVAFFHKREEKLIISDFVDNGSLASHLHIGRRRGDQPAGLKWSTRLKIIKGVARGLAYLYRELPHLALPHGHLKSSNVLLDEHFEPLLADYALAPLVNRDHAEQIMVAYKSPEFTENNMITKKTDVWCLGILILETLTGQFPTNYLKHGRGGNDELATWVNQVIKEEWSSDMFDVEMRASKGSKGEMLKLLKIGMWCCEWNVEKRWSLREAVEKIEELKENDKDDDHQGEFPSIGSGRELYSTISSITEENVSFRD